MDTDTRCIDCRWCQWWVDSYGGSRYECEKKPGLLTSGEVGLAPCDAFEAPQPASAS